MPLRPTASLFLFIAMLFVTPVLAANAKTASAPDRWRRVESRYFVMLSAANEREAIDWAVELHLYFSMLSQFVAVDSFGRSPLTVLMFKDDAAHAPFKLPVAGRFTPAAAYIWRSKVASIIAMSPQENSAGTRRLLYHDGMHWLMGRFARANPVWFEEGLAELYSSMEIKSDRIMLGLPILPHLALLRRNGLMPTHELLEIGRESYLYNEATRDSRLYAQAWLMVHQLFFEAQDNRSTGVARYLADVQRGASAAEAFQQVFGLSSQEMDVRLGAHLRKERHVVPGLRFDRARVEADLRRSEAESWEVDLALGVLANGGGQKDVALRLLTGARDKKADDPRAHFWLGDMALGREDYVEALRSFDRAIAAGANDYAAYYERAVATLRVHRPKGDLAGLDSAIVRAMADDLTRAIEHTPWEKPSYDFFVSLLQVMEAPTPEDKRIVEEALHRWPNSADFRFVAARLDEIQGRWGDARLKFEQILEQNPPAPAGMRTLIVQHLEALSAAEQDAEINALWRKRDYPGLLACLDRVLRKATPARKKHWAHFREQVVIHEKLERAEQLMAGDRRETAVSLLEEIVAAPTVDWAAKDRARKLLQEHSR